MEKNSLVKLNGFSRWIRRAASVLKKKKLTFANQVFLEKVNKTTVVNLRNRAAGFVEN